MAATSPPVAKVGEVGEANEAGLAGGIGRASEDDDVVEAVASGIPVETDVLLPAITLPCVNDDDEEVEWRKAGFVGRSGDVTAFFSMFPPRPGSCTLFEGIVFPARDVALLYPDDDAEGVLVRKLG